MDVRLLWAGVWFTAQNGDAESLLSEAARAGLHLSAVSPAPGGFSGRCAAWQYRNLAALARKRRVRLRIQTRTGLYFRLRPFLRRRGLWVGVLLFVPLLVWSQDLVWAVDAGSLTTGQRARAEAILREQVQLMPGSAVTQEKLTAGEYALLQSGEFSWASLNFLDGRLVVEAAAAKPVPDIAAGKADGVFAKAAGTVVRTNLVSGTMLAAPGQAVEAGQLLIGTSRTERDGTLIYEPAAGAIGVGAYAGGTAEHYCKTADRKALFKTGDLNKWAAHFTSVMEAFFRRNCTCDDTAYPTGYSWVWPSLFGRRDNVFRTNRAGNSIHRRAGARACETAQFAGAFPRLSGRRVCGTKIPLVGFKSTSVY